MDQTTKEPKLYDTGDVVMKEVWRIKDELSASYNHDVDRLFAEARERQKHSGHKVVNLQTKRPKAA
jgi:hypothetical protein